MRTRQQATWGKSISILVSYLCCAAAVVSAQDYRAATVTFTDGRSEAWQVLAEAPGDIARQLIVRGIGDVDTVRSVDEIESLDFGQAGYYRQVLRTFRGFDGDTKTVARLARRLLRGPASLYRLDLRKEEKAGIEEVDDFGTWTYYLEREGQMLELPQEEVSEGGYRRRRAYIGRLNFLLQDCAKLNARLKSDPPRYRDSDLTEVLTLYADCLEGEVEVEIAPQLRSRPKFDGLLAQGGFFNVNRPGVLSERLPMVGARVGLRVGRSSTPSSYLEAGVDYVFTDAVEDDSRLAVPAIFLPLTVRIEGPSTDLIRPFLRAGMLFAPPTGGVNRTGSAVLLTGGVGAHIGPARVDLSLTPTAVSSDEQVSFVIGTTVGYSFGKPAKLRRRVPE